MIGQHNRRGNFSLTQSSFQRVILLQSERLECATVRRKSNGRNIHIATHLESVLTYRAYIATILSDIFHFHNSAPKLMNLVPPGYVTNLTKLLTNC